MGVLSFSAEFIKRKQGNKIKQKDFISFIRNSHIHLPVAFAASEAQARIENLGTAPSTQSGWQRDTQHISRPTWLFPVPITIQAGMLDEL